MKHYDEDIIYKFVLDILDASESEQIRKHSGNCDLCQMKITEINKRIELIGSYNPKIELKRDKKKSDRKYNSTIAKAAAVTLIGLTIGYSVIDYSFKENIVVVGQSFIPQNSIEDSLKFVDCPNIDINTEY